jgi:hypothetical protein
MSKEASKSTSEEKGNHKTTSKTQQKQIKKGDSVVLLHAEDKIYATIKSEADKETDKHLYDDETLKRMNAGEKFWWVHWPKEPEMGPLEYLVSAGDFQLKERAAGVGKRKGSKKRKGTKKKNPPKKKKAPKKKKSSRKRKGSTKGRR